MIILNKPSGCLCASDTPEVERIKNQPIYFTLNHLINIKIIQLDTLNVIFQNKLFEIYIF